MKRLAFLLLLAGSSSALADWKLDNDSSSLNFISTKNQHISETHSFGELSGSLSEQGKLKVEVTLSSVNTGIDIRDQRMRDILFHVADIPSAMLTAKLDKALLETEQGKTAKASVDALFDLNGKTHTLPVAIQVTKLADGSLLATTTKPVVLNAKDFSLDGGIGELQKIAGLAGISLAVPVTFNVTFTPAG